MASGVAPPKNTGGGGFEFENSTCAWLLASMLVGDLVFGDGCGTVVRIDFQTRPDGWFLDDVLVTTSIGAVRHRFALSIKSNAQFTATTAPADFVAVAWEQWLHVGSTTFDTDLDFMVLVTDRLSEAATQSVSGLAEKASANDPALLPSRLETANWASADERKLFKSFACPSSLGRKTTDADAARLLQRLRFIQHDFGAVSSESQRRALELCRRAVRSQTTADAQALWSVLCGVASELRPQAGSLTLFDLVDRLRARVVLAAYPDHRGDWATLDARSKREADLVRASIGDRVHVSRDETVAEVIAVVAANMQVALLGASGIGKSALAKAVFEKRTSSGERTLWIDASSLDRIADFGAFEASLQLRHSLAELMATDGSRDPIVVLDGLDRLYTDSSFRAVASLLRLVRGGRERATQWRTVAVCQSQEWPRVLEGLQRVGAPLTAWRICEASTLKPADLQPIRDAVPSLARLLHQPQVATLLTNLKLLDLVVRRLDGGNHVDVAGWVGESSVAEWFWNAEIDRGPDRLARGQFVRGLAQAQADQLAVAVAVDSLEASSLSAAQTLSADQLLVQVSGDRIAFAHDLYGDWARLRILINRRDDLAAFLQTRHESPLWHRAIRLFGIHVLERGGGVTEWRTLIGAFGGGGLSVVRDLLLEAPAFAMNARLLLDSIFPDLVAVDGLLLRRLLTRFLAFATVPNEAMQAGARAVGMDANAARASFRRPHWPYWLDVLAFLHAHRMDVVRVAACETAKIVEMWLEFVPSGSILRPEAAELGVMLGQRAVESRENWRGRDERSDRQRFYKCALLAAPERPVDVAQLARVAAERVPRPVKNAVESPPHPLSRSIFGPGEMRGPWSDGPLARVDDDFEHVVLEGLNILPLFRVRPAVAREVILATLIEAPREVHWGSSRLHDGELEFAYRFWQPSLFTRGPFCFCLRENFEEGLELIMRLVEFATERSNERQTRRVNEWRAQASADGRSVAEIEDEVKQTPPQFLLLHDGSEEHRFVGDAGSYGWSSGVTLQQGYSPLPPSAVASALMALEQYLYQKLDAGQDITDDVTRVFSRSRCVAVLGVLSDVGKRQASLFAGPLRKLLSAPELYSWDIAKTIHGRTHLMIGAATQGQLFIKSAQQFHSLEHRRLDLRHVARDLLLGSEEIQAFFASVRAWWKARTANGEQLVEIADQLDLLLDPANYHERDDQKHGRFLVNVALERVHVAQAAERQVMNDRALVTTFPVRCRKILDERRVLADAQLDEFWRSWQRVRELATAGPALPGGEERFGDEYVNAITGGIAVLLWHDEWASRDSNRRQEIEDSLESVIERFPEKDPLRSEHDSSQWTWDCFVAEAAVSLWVQRSQDVRWRRLVAQMVFSEKYETVRLLFARCAEFRTKLSADFQRLRRLAIDWAHVRERVDALLGVRQLVPTPDAQLIERFRATTEKWTEQLVSSFVDGSLATVSGDWSKFGDEACFAEFDALRRRWPDYLLMDFHLVKVSHEWMPPLADAQSPEERADTIQFWRVALDVVAARPRADLQRRDHQYPNEDEVWVLENVATAVMQMRETENPAHFWMAIIDLHSGAHDWPEQFLRALHRQALAAAAPPAPYPSLLFEIAQYAFSDVNGERRWPGHEEVWDALLGIDNWVSDLWSDRHAGYVQSIWHIVSLWMERVPLDGKRLGRFARWLSNAAAASIRLRVLPWFVRSIQPGRALSTDRDEGAANSLATFLNVVWDEQQPSLRTSTEQFAAFRALLLWLVERQNPRGLELQGRIAGLA